MFTVFRDSLSCLVKSWATATPLTHSYRKEMKILDRNRVVTTYHYSKTDKC